jgi:hypothetical protein
MARIEDDHRPLLTGGRRHRGEHSDDECKRGAQP